MKQKMKRISFIYTINWYSHAFLCNFEDKLHSEWAKITLVTLMQLLSPTPHVIIPELHQKHVIIYTNHDYCKEES